MPITPLPLIIIRPESGASATVERAEAMGFVTVKAPLFSVEPMAWETPDADQYDALLLTSANAAREAGAGNDAGLAAVRGLPCLAVGEATAEAARSVGLEPVWVGDSTGGAALVEAAKRGHKRVLWLSGEQHSPLAHRDIALTVTPVYRARNLEASDALKQALRHPAMVMVHSQRAAWALAELVESGEERARLGLIAISAGVAATAGEGWAWVKWPQAPRDEDMLELTRTLCQKTRP